MAWYDCQISDVIDVRTFTTLYRREPFENWCLLWVVAGSGLLSLAVVYLPFGNLVLALKFMGLKNHD